MREGILWKIVRPQPVLDLVYFDSVCFCVVKYYYKYGREDEDYLSIAESALQLYKENFKSCTEFLWKDLGAYLFGQFLGFFVFHGLFSYSIAVGGRLGFVCD